MKRGARVRSTTHAQRPVAPRPERAEVRGRGERAARGSRRGEGSRWRELIYKESLCHAGEEIVAPRAGRERAVAHAGRQTGANGAPARVGIRPSLFSPSLAWSPQRRPVRAARAAHLHRARERCILDLIICGQLPSHPSGDDGRPLCSSPVATPSGDARLFGRRRVGRNVTADGGAGPVMAMSRKTRAGGCFWRANKTRATQRVPRRAPDGWCPRSAGATYHGGNLLPISRLPRAPMGCRRCPDCYDRSRAGGPAALRLGCSGLRDLVPPTGISGSRFPTNTISPAPHRPFAPSACQRQPPFLSVSPRTPQSLRP